MQKILKGVGGEKHFCEFADIVGFTDWVLTHNRGDFDRFVADLFCIPAFRMF